MNQDLLSVQLYSVRDAMDRNVPSALSRIASIGFKQVETYNSSAFPGLRDALDSAGLIAPTTHEHFVGISEGEQDELFAAARSLGASLVIDPHVPADRWATAESIVRIAEELNEAALVAARHGLTLGYHNHEFEAESTIDGRTPLEVLAENLSPAVFLEVDVYWAAVGGQDVAALLTKLGDRVIALHIKDGTLNPQHQTAVGSGELPLREIVEAAPNALRIVEMDEDGGDPFAAIAESYEYLTKEGLA